MNLDETLNYITPEMLERKIVLDFLKNNDLDLHNIVTSNEYDKLIVLWFDATCSTCIAEYLNYLMKTELNPNNLYLYIAHTDLDLLLVDFYSEKYARNLKNNEFIIPDIASNFEMQNPSIYMGEATLFEIDNSLEIVETITLSDFLKQKYLNY